MAERTKADYAKSAKAYSDMYRPDPSYEFLGGALFNYIKFQECKPTPTEEQQLLASLAPKVQEAIQKYSGLPIQAAMAKFKADEGGSAEEEEQSAIDALFNP